MKTGKSGEQSKKSLQQARFFVVKLLKKNKICDIINEYRVRRYFLWQNRTEKRRRVRIKRN